MQLKPKSECKIVWSMPDFSDDDKIDHLVAGAWLSAVFGATGNLGLGFCVCVFCGLIKEVYDYFVKGRTCDSGDFIATCIGGVVGYLGLLIAITIYKA